MNSEKNSILKKNLYYAYVGNISWLKIELQKKRFEALKYFKPVESKHNYNVIVIIEKPLEKSEDKFISVCFLKKFLLVFTKKKMLIKNLKLKPDESELLFKHLQQTFHD